MRLIWTHTLLLSLFHFSKLGRCMHKNFFVSGFWLRVRILKLVGRPNFWLRIRILSIWL